MSLRLRLTLLYTTLLGGVLLLFGVVVYLLVSVTLVNQIDTLLEETASQVINTVTVDASGNVRIRAFPTIELAESVVVQLWGANGQLRETSPNVSRIDESIDPNGLRATQPVYRYSTIQGVRLRVFSIPLVIGERPVGVLQVGTGLSLVDTTQRSLLTVLIAAALAAMTVAGLAGYLATGQALGRLQAVTQVADQITHADDLSRRIPMSGPAGDEVSILIRAFNETLGRLETLFTAQRRFLADVSHELRTPLTVIKGNVALMRKFNEADEESLSGIENEVDRLTRLVGNLLLLAQAESGKIPLDMQPVELDTVLLEVFQQMRVLAGERLNLRVTEIDQVQVQGDRDRLKQVLFNLVGNALKYTPAGGQVNLSLCQVGSQARLTITDNGPGIPARDLPHIFERFYRAEKSRTRAKDGSGYGLGLSIAYWIVTNHGGRIEVDSREGRGTTFSVYLPLQGTKEPPQE